MIRSCFREVLEAHKFVRCCGVPPDLSDMVDSGVGEVVDVEVFRVAVSHRGVVAIALLDVNRSCYTLDVEG